MERAVINHAECHARTLCIVDSSDASSIEIMCRLIATHTNTSAGYSQAFRSAQGVPALVKVLNLQKNASVMGAAAAALSALMTKDKFIQAEFGNEGGMSALVRLLSCSLRENMVVMEQACNTAAMAMLHNVENRVIFGAEYGLRALIALFCNPHNGAAVVESACRAAANAIHDNAANATEFAAAGGMFVLGKLLQSNLRDRAEVMTHACRVASEAMVENTQNRVAFGEVGGMSSLVALLSRFRNNAAVMESVCLAAGNAMTNNTIQNVIQFVAAEGIPSLARLLVSNLRDNATVMEAACWATVNALVTDENRAVFGIAQGIPALVGLLIGSLHTNNTIMYYTCWAAMNAMVDPDNRVAFGVSGGMAALVVLFVGDLRGDAGVMNYACKALANAIQNNPANASAFRAAGGIQPLIRLLNSDVRLQIHSDSTLLTNMLDSLALNLVRTELQTDVPIVPTLAQVRGGSRIVHLKDVPNEETCAVCQERDTENVWRRLYCTHYFHRKCIDRWFLQNVHCAVCRADIRTPDGMHDEEEEDIGAAYDEDEGEALEEELMRDNLEEKTEEVSYSPVFLVEEESE